MKLLVVLLAIFMVFEFSERAGWASTFHWLDCSAVTERVGGTISCHAGGECSQLPWDCVVPI